MVKNWFLNLMYSCYGAGFELSNNVRYTTVEQIQFHYRDSRVTSEKGGQEHERTKLKTM